MKRLKICAWLAGLALVLSAFLGTPPTDAATTSGTLTADEVWSGTINISGDVTVPKGVTLTIEPGTEIVRVTPLPTSEQYHIYNS